ncbi:MAG: M14 family metallopeptidase [Bacteroidota bacterium]|nr:M14 family metallopeptidase [Bacteroidota bacterium]
MRAFLLTIVFFIFNNVAFAQTSDNYMQFFPESYSEARESFVKKANILIDKYDNAKLFELKVASKIDDDLTVNALFIPAKKTEKLLIISSGVHGVEGFVGSAIQQMFMDKFISENLTSNTGILLIHSVNPYGFKYFRRVSENNVDLNRNCSTDDSLYDIINEGYPEVSDFINPTVELDLSKCMHSCFFLRAMKMVAKASIPVLRQAILQGQYEYPKSLYYGGNTFEPQIKLLTPFIDSVCTPYSTIMTIDLHTGYGERGVLHLFPNPVPEKTKIFTESIFEGYKIDWGDGDDFYTVTGDFSNYVGSINKNKKHIPMTFEYGTMNSQTTIGSIKSLHIMVMENQMFQYSYKSKRDSLKASKKFIEMYYPSSEKWRISIMEQTVDIFESVIPKFQNSSVE